MSSSQEHKTFHKASRQGCSRAALWPSAGRARCRLAQARERSRTAPQQRQAPREMQTGQSIRACLRREVPADHEARSQASAGPRPGSRSRTSKAKPRQDAAGTAAGRGVVRTQKHSFGGGRPWKPKRNANHDRPTLRCSERADSCGLATWSGERPPAQCQEGKEHSSEWCWAVQQTTHQRVNAGRTTVDDRGNRAVQSPTKSAECRPLRERLSDEAFLTTHKSGHAHGTAECTTMPRSASTTQSSRALEDTSTRAGRGGVRRTRGSARGGGRESSKQEHTAMTV